MSTRSMLLLAPVLVPLLLLVTPRSLAQAAPNSSKARSGASASPVDPVIWEIRHYGDASKLRPQFQLRCSAARKQLQAVSGNEENDEVIEAVFSERWSDVPDGKAQLVTDYLNAEVESDRSCGALKLDRGQKGLGLQDLENLTNDIGLRDAWRAWLRQKELEKLTPWGTAENVQRACQQAKQDLSRLAIQSDPLILRAAHQTSYDQIPSGKTTEALDYYYVRASIGYTCGMAAFARGEFGPAESSFTESATYATRALNFAIQRFNQLLVGDYHRLSDAYDKLAQDDAKAWKLVDQYSQLADRALSAADRALLSIPPSVTIPVFVPSAPMQPIELHCVTTTTSFGTAYTNCY